jgi:hypothetical protein
MGLENKDSQAESGHTSDHASTVNRCCVTGGAGRSTSIRGRCTTSGTGGSSCPGSRSGSESNTLLLTRRVCISTTYLCFTFWDEKHVRLGGTAAGRH